MSRPWTKWVIVGIFAFSTNAFLLLQAQDKPAGADNTQDSPLAVEPTTPEEQFEAAILMTELGRFDLAKKYIQQLVDDKLSDKELLSIRDRFGTVELFRLSRTKQLQPASQTLLNMVTEASRKNASDPARIDRILADLDKSPREREMAILELKNIGIAAMPRLIQHLGNPDSEQDRDRLVYIMTKMGRPVLPALFGALDSHQPMLQTSVLDAIGFLAQSDMVEPLWYFAFGEEEPPAVRAAARVALARILFGTAEKTKYITAHGSQDRIMNSAFAYLGNKKTWPTDDAGRVTLWKWDSAQATVKSFSVTPVSASIDSAVKYASQALKMPGEKKEVQALFLSAVLADAAYRIGWKESMSTGPGTSFNLALTSGLPVLNRSVEISLEAGQIRAAEAALAAMSLVGNDNLLKTTPNEASVFIRGLNHPSRRIQFAAAVGILQLEPEQSFRFAGRVVEILTQALNDDGSRKVLVIDPNNARGSGIATAVSQMGYNQQTVSTGKEGFEQAAGRGDISLVLIHLNCIDWDLSQTIANFRADARTAGLPIVVYGPTFMENELLTTVQRTSRCMYLVYSDKRKDVEKQLTSFLTAQTAPTLTAQQRAVRAESSAYWLAQIAQGSRSGIFDLAPAAESLFNAIRNPALASDAVAILAKIPTNESQMFLAETVVALKQLPEVRQQAALSLAFHVQKHGLLIEKELIVDLKALWKNEQDPEVQTALTSVIGSLKPSTAMTESRMQSFAIPALPAQN